MNTTLPLALATVLNLWAAGGWLLKKDYVFALVFLCYAVASACFLIKGLKT